MFDLSAVGVQWDYTNESKDRTEGYCIPGRMQFNRLGEMIIEYDQAIRVYDGGYDVWDLPQKKLFFT